MDNTCPHCGKTGAIVKDNWYPHHAARCYSCGYWIDMSLPGKMAAFGRKEWLETGAKSDKDQRPVKCNEFVPCPVVGCVGKMMRSNPRGMCGACASLLRNWENGRKTMPAPLQQDADGVWHRAKRAYVMEAA